MAKSRSPYLTRFLSDFTLGFSDGLTVPFALTAGLSSLGRADTVISAGLAELCAGSISMGIGGYLAALDELPSASSQHGKRSRSDVAGDEEELRGMLHDGGSGSTSVASDGDSTRESMDEKERGAEVRDEDLVRQHLEPLALSDSVMSEMLESLRRSPDDLSRAAARVQQQRRQVSIHDPSLSEPQLPVWPVASGLSISLGYVVGGIIPLFPYFFAATVGLALRWSIGLCLVALMAFGSGKSWVLRGEDRSWRRCLLEGSQMLVLGSLAAGAAVLCVNLVGSSGEPSS